MGEFNIAMVEFLLGSFACEFSILASEFSISR